MNSQLNSNASFKLNQTKGIVIKTLFVSNKEGVLILSRLTPVGRTDLIYLCVSIN